MGVQVVREEMRLKGSGEGAQEVGGAAQGRTLAREWLVLG